MPATGGALAPSGALALKVIRGGDDTPEPGDIVPVVREWPGVTDDRMHLDMKTVLKFGMPQAGLEDAVNEWRLKNQANLWRGLRRAMGAKMLGIPTAFGALFVAKLDGETGEHIDYGLASLRVVTDAGVAAIVDAFDVGVGFTLSNFRYHGMGTGSTAEAASQTALVTELTTEYNPNSTRATGTATQPSANIYQSVGTNTIDSGTPAVTEHGLLSQAATGGGTLWDRSVFSAINLVGANGDGIQFTYQGTFTSGG